MAGCRLRDDHDAFFDEAQETLSFSELKIHKVASIVVVNGS